MVSITSYIVFGRKALALLATNRLMFITFLIVSVLAALTEGIGIGLLVPILQTQADPNGFDNIPVLGWIATQFSGYSDNERIKLTAIILMLTFIFRGLIQYAASTMSQIMPIYIQRVIVERNYHLMMGIRISYLADSNYGDLYNDIIGWALLVTNLLTNFAILMLSGLTLLIYVTMMLLVSWRLSLLAMGFMLIVALVLRAHSTGVLHRVGGRMNDAKARLDHIIMESLVGMKLIRLRAAETIMEKTFLTHYNQVASAQRSAALIFSRSNPVLETSSGIFICVLLFASAVMYEGDSHAWVGNILIFLFLIFRLLGPVTQIDNARTRISNLMPAFERMERFQLSAREMEQPNGARTIQRLHQGVVFDNVSFAYKAEGSLVLDRVSTTIPRGRMTAIVGPSGAGKSTLINLITRLYDPQSGRILVDGVDLNDLDVRSWRKRLAVVSQDIFIFNDTVANNIRFGFDEVPMDRVREAVKLASAESFVNALPEGYDTLLGDRGMRLSGGQQQRIAIARAILADPDLLIMDEATSHLDTFAERAIQQALDQLSQDRTLLVIAHRLSTIRRADNVIVLSEGRIVEEGRHEDLLRQRGSYWEMVEHQRLELVDEDRVTPAAEMMV